MKQHQSVKKSSSKSKMFLIHNNQPTSRYAPLQSKLCNVLNCAGFKPHVVDHLKKREREKKSQKDDLSADIASNIRNLHVTPLSTQPIFKFRSRWFHKNRAIGHLPFRVSPRDQSLQLGPSNRDPSTFLQPERGIYEIPQKFHKTKFSKNWLHSKVVTCL